MRAYRYHAAMPPARHRVQRIIRQHRRIITNVQLGALTLTAALAAVWLATDLGRLEPLTLLITLLASIGTLLATRLAPPVTQLDATALRDLIAYSDADEDWERIPVHGSTTMAYRWDTSLRIIDEHLDDRDEFDEPWIPRYWNGVTKFTVRVQQSDLVAFELALLSVDGGRSVLPLPAAPNDMRITRLQDTIAHIVKGVSEDHYPYDRYLEQAKVSVVESSERRVGQEAP